MPEPHEAPGAGEPASSETPGTGAASAPGAGAPSSTGGVDLHQEGFRTGYGKGAEKGRREGQELVLKALGLPVDVEAARAALDGWRQQSEQHQQAQPIAQETQEYRALATQFREQKQELEALRSKLGPLEKRADEARLEKLRGAARRKGVGEGQLEALVAMHGSRVRLGDDGSLEVLSPMPDGSMVAAGQAIDSFLGEVVEANPWLLAPQQPRGGGSSMGGVVGASRGGPSADMVDRRPLSERRKDLR